MALMAGSASAKPVRAGTVFSTPVENPEVRHVARPDQADTWMQMGQSLMSRGQYDAADSTFRAALRLSPDCHEARIGLARIAWYRGDLEAAQAQLTNLDDHPGAQQLTREIEAATIVGFEAAQGLEVALGVSGLLDNVKTWAGRALAGERPLPRRSRFAALSEYSLQFDLDDVYFQTRVNHRLGADTKAYVSLGGALNTASRPRASLLGGISMPADTVFSRLPGGGHLSLDGRIASYANGDLARTSIAFNTSLLDDRLRIVSRGILVSDIRDQVREGFSLDGEVQAGEASKLVLSYADTPEISRGLTIDVVSTSLALRHDLTSDMDVSLAATHEQKRSYEQTGITFGMTRNF